ncbi:hypothetical protein FACS1894171_2730 [Clostridia bacterium]|nr:hypothetical protein FACS1894171_2730 [Clostridia bacterium]
MTAMPIPFYRCCKCRKEFDSFKAAKSCENAHLKPVSAKAVRYTIRQYPYSVEITFNNGEHKIYNAEDLGG